MCAELTIGLLSSSRIRRLVALSAALKSREGQKSMAANKRLRSAWLGLKFHAVERWHDLLNVIFPVFVMTGLVAVCARFWLWVLF